MNLSIFSEYPQPIPQTVLDYITPVNKIEAKQEFDKVEMIIRELEENNQWDGGDKL